ncbi:hypothetical protein AB4097_20605 [Microvirga sp. 2MCAF35]|uniref:hypothetical protein n=1 Tax=Microvirga sp. 2MCAF35 TaxID=3232987 RepID=UPI003F9A47A8
MRLHRYAVGQHVSYAEEWLPNQIWVGGYEIVSLLPAGNREPQYQIRTDGQTYDQVVWESQVQEEFGRRMRLNKDAMRATMDQKRNDPKRSDHRQDLRRWDDEGGAPRSGHHFSAAPPSQPEAETALYYFNIQPGVAASRTLKGTDTVTSRLREK